MHKWTYFILLVPHLFFNLGPSSAIFVILPYPKSKGLGEKKNNFKRVLKIELEYFWNLWCTELCGSMFWVSAKYLLNLKNIPVQFWEVFWKQYFFYLFFLKQNIPITVNRSNYASIIILIYNYTIYTYSGFCKFMLFITPASHIRTILFTKVPLSSLSRYPSLSILRCPQATFPSAVQEENAGRRES